MMDINLDVYNWCVFIFRWVNLKVNLAITFLEITLTETMLTYLIIQRVAKADSEPLWFDYQYDQN